METALLGGRNEATVKHDNEDRKPKGPPVLKNRIPSLFCKINRQYHENAISQKTRPSIKRRYLNHSIPKMTFQAIGNSDGRKIPYQPWTHKSGFQDLDITILYESDLTKRRCFASSNLQLTLYGR